MILCRLGISNIHGIGVFALCDIPAGTKIIYQYDTIVTHEIDEATFAQLPEYEQKEILDRTIFIEGEPLSYLDPYSTVDFRAFMNHSDTPNTDGIYALRDIKEGEELTEDYTTMGNPHQLTRNHMTFIWN